MPAQSNDLTARSLCCAHGIGKIGFDPGELYTKPQTTITPGLRLARRTRQASTQIRGAPTTLSYFALLNTPIESVSTACRTFKLGKRVLLNWQCGCEQLPPRAAIPPPLCQPPCTPSVSTRRRARAASVSSAALPPRHPRRRGGQRAGGFPSLL